MALRIRIATRLPTAPSTVIVTMSAAQANGKRSRQKTACASRGITTAHIGPIVLANTKPTLNTSSVRRHGVRQVTPLNATATKSAAATFNAVIRNQYRAVEVILMCPQAEALRHNDHL